MTKIAEFKRVITDVKAINQLQDAVAPIARDLSSKEILRGILLEDIEVTTSGKQISHKLGRKYKGWILVRKNADESIWETESPDSAKFLVLDTSGTVTVSLWVF